MSPRGRFLFGRSIRDATNTNGRTHAPPGGGRRFPDRGGYNIGALLVTPRAEIVCFALNRSIALDSTMAHAEARAVCTAIKLKNIERDRSNHDSMDYSDLLRGWIAYTTLEPCSQCSGIMEL